MALESDRHPNDLQLDGDNHDCSSPHSATHLMDVQVDRFPQSSQHMQAMCLQHLALSLDVDLPTTTTTTTSNTSSSVELREMIENKLTLMKQSATQGQGNTQVTLQYAFAGAILQLMDAYGVMLDAESAENGPKQEDLTHHDGASDYSMFYSPVPSTSQALDTYRLQIQDLEMERERLDDTILVLRDEVERERERNEELQQLINEQNTEIDSLKMKLCELEEARDGTTSYPTTALASSLHDATPAVRKSPRWADKKTDTSQSSTPSPTKCKDRGGVTIEVRNLSKPLLRNRGKSLFSKTHRCELCDKTFEEQHHLTVHLQQHTGDKPYKCRICKRRFGRNDALRRHIRSHARNT